MTAAPAPRPLPWPKCPKCGRDELWSSKPPEWGHGRELMPRPLPTDPMFCLACGWRGVAVAR